MSLLKAGEGFVQSLTKNLQTSYGEVASEIAGNYAKAVERNSNAKIINAAMKSGSEQAAKIANNLPNSADKAFAKEMNDKIQAKGVTDKEKFNWIRQKQVERHGSALIGNAVFAGQVAKAYMFQDGKKAARMGTYAAGAVGLRVISGGTLTHNNTGERDIAGVPFI